MSTAREASRKKKYVYHNARLFGREVLRGLLQVVLHSGCEKALIGSQQLSLDLDRLGDEALGQVYNFVHAQRQLLDLPVSLDRPL